jgi:DNA-binding beta-propeller fold protein YncE
MTVLSATNWNVTKKIALPDQHMNNGHNLWTSHDQKQIYQTEWHGNSLYVLDRKNGTLLQELELKDRNGNIFCHDPAHVMTRVDTQQVHVGCNGDDTVAEFNRTDSGRLQFHKLITVSKRSDKYQAQPHAHWMGFDGRSMVTPNSNTGDSTLFDFNEYAIIDKEQTGTLPIATGMMPDSSKFYVSNYLGDTISVMCGPYPKTRCRPGQKIKDINLLQGYAPASGLNTAGFLGLDGNIITKGLLGGFSVQTPVSPDGKFAIQGNTLSGTITIIDTKTDTLVRSLACDPGCHGVNFGAKKGGGYYAYVTSKFANRLIVLDYDPNNDGDVSDAKIEGAVVLANDHPAYIDDTIAGNRGFGGQGVMAVPNVYNGWVQQLPGTYKIQLTEKQRHPIGH